MPSRPAPLSTCFCETCVRKGGTNDHSERRGITMNAHEFKMHQIRLERELSNETPTQPTEDDLQRASSAMFTSTLLVDDGISNYHTTSTSAPDNPNPDPFSSSAINAIATSVGRLARRSDRESSPPTPSVPNNQPPHSLDSRKKDRSQHTVKAVSILERALDTLRECATRLNQSPTPQTTADVESTVRETRRAVDSINRDAVGVNDIKLQITQQLNNLEARLLELRHLLPDEQSFPYDSGQLFFLLPSFIFR